MTITTLTATIFILFIFFYAFSFRRVRRAQYSPVCYYDRNDRLVAEKNDHLSLLHFLYKTRAGKFSRFFLDSRFIHFIIELYIKSGLSRSAIASFVKQHELPLEQYRVPDGGYLSFHDFFIRELQSGARPIARSALCSPADGKLLAFKVGNLDQKLSVKNSHKSIREFFHNSPLLDSFKDPVLIAIRLAPADYHRFHFPFDCIPGEAQFIGGSRESVNPVVFDYGINPWIRNQRVIIPLYNNYFYDNTHNTDKIYSNNKNSNKNNIRDRSQDVYEGDPTTGEPVALLMPIGALFVGSITLTYTAGRSYLAGEQAGYFSFGGSTVLLLYNCSLGEPKKIYLERSVTALSIELAQNKKAYVIQPSLDKQSTTFYETEVLMGQSLLEDTQ